MSVLCIDLGSVDIDIETIADEAASTGGEEALLLALAKAEEAYSGEGEWAVEAGKRCRELAKWFRETQR